MNETLVIVFQLVVLVFSVMVHEIAHGAVALRLGDPTAKLSGRLTLNPLRHIDPVGSVLLPLMLLTVASLAGERGILFGWAKPVPYNPLRLKDPKRGAGLIAVAGPLTNFAIAFIFGLLLRILAHAAPDSFNPAGLPAGSALPVSLVLMGFFQMIVLINISLAVFNLLPIPPLDGSTILFSFIREDILRKFQPFLLRYGFLLLLLVVFFGVPAVQPIISFLYRAITGS